MFKRLVPPSRSFVEWKFGELENQLRALQSAVELSGEEVKSEKQKICNIERMLGGGVKNRKRL